MRPLSLCHHALATLLLVAACGDDADPTDGGASSPSDTSAGDASSDSVDTSAGESESGSGELGPTARVRVINLVEGLELTAWGADTNFDPVVLAEGLTYASASEYFDAPLDQNSMEPEIVLVPAGEAVENVSTWQIDNNSGLDRAFVTFRELHGAGEQGTIVLTPDHHTGNLQWSQLDETELMLGDPGMTTLHVSWNLFDLEGSVVPAFAVVGDPCLFVNSTGLPEPWSVAPGTFEVGIYDRQMVSECSVLLGSTEITAAADEHVLVAVYHEGATVKLFSVPVAR